MTAPAESSLRDDLFGAGFGGAERDRSEVPLVRGKDDPTLIIVAQSGLSGFAARAVVDPPKPQAKSQGSWPARSAPLARIEQVSPPAQRNRYGEVIAFGTGAGADEKPVPAPTQTSVASSSTMNSRVRPDPNCVVLTIAPGGEAAFAVLEARMGVPVSGLRRAGAGAIWGERRTADGSREIGFQADLHQRLALAPLVGELGSSSLMLSIGTADATGFRRTGPGAIGRDAAGGLPQISDASVEALRRCFV